MTISLGIEFFVEPVSTTIEGAVSEPMTMFSYSEGTIGPGTLVAFTTDISDAPLLRGPQVKSRDLNEDRLLRTTSYVLDTVTAIDLTATGTTTLLTAPNDQSALILGVILQATQADTVTVAPQVSVGLNPSTDNVFATEPLVGFDTVDALYYMWSNTNKAVVIPASGVLDLDVSVAATATSLEATARVIGILV